MRRSKPTDPGHRTQEVQAAPTCRGRHPTDRPDTGPRTS